MRITQNFILLLLISTFFLFSCNNDNRNTQLLSEAEYLLESNPQEALTILDSMEAPAFLNEDAHMKYIVTSIAAKKETQGNITTDTAIFEAVNYFKDKKDYKYNSLANYYAGWVYYLNNKSPQSLESFLNAAYYAQKSNNDLLTANSFNHIGYIYYEQDLFDSAVVNCMKALPYFDKVQNVEERKLVTLTNIGRAYEASNKLDSAILYFDKCLSLAKETNNELYQFHSLKNIGIVYYNKKEYNQAIKRFEVALAVNVSLINIKIEYDKIHRHLLHIYNEEHNITSAKKYAELVIASIPQVEDPYTLKGMYSALADYYEQAGDYKKALDYRNLEIDTKQLIANESTSEALLQADKDFYLTQKDKEAAQYRSQLCFVFIIGSIVVLVLIIFAFFIWKDHKKRKKDIKFHADKYDEMKDILIAMGNEYPAIEAEIKSMLEED